jgi:DNA invertase Pin-like site-specific DNA recombinase
MDIGLARVSTLDQDPRLQLDALRRAGCDHIYEERASGVSTKRPVRDRALRSLGAGDTLTVWKLDRLGRSLTELNDIVTDLKERGIAFRCLTQPIDTSSSLGWMFFQLLAVFAEFERSLIVERTKAGLQRARDEGVRLGQRSYGWKQDGVTQISKEADLLREAARRLLEDKHSMNAIADDWNQRGLTSAKGGRWTATSLRRMLANPMTAAIVGTDAYNTLQGLFSDPESRKRQGRPAQRLLSGILHCGVCTSPMYARPGKVRGAKNVRYHCKHGVGGRYQGCGKVSISMAADDEVRDRFIKEVASERFSERLRAIQVAAIGDAYSASQLAADRQELGELKAIIGTRFATQEHRDRYSKLSKHIREMEARLATLPDLEDLQALPRAEDQLRQRWEQWSVTERRRNLKLVLHAVLVKPASNTSSRLDRDRLAPVWKHEGPTGEMVELEPLSKILGRKIEVSKTRPSDDVLDELARDLQQGPVSQSEPF